MSVRDHKALKHLKTENLRDHMTDAELVFTALAELSTRQIAGMTPTELGELADMIADQSTLLLGS